MGHFGCVFGCVYVREVMIACPHAAYGSEWVLGPLSCQWERAGSVLYTQKVSLAPIFDPHIPV